MQGFSPSLRFTPPATPSALFHADNAHGVPAESLQRTSHPKVTVYSDAGGLDRYPRSLRVPSEALPRTTTAKGIPSWSLGEPDLQGIGSGTGGVSGRNRRRLLWASCPGAFSNRRIQWPEDTLSDPKGPGLHDDRSIPDYQRAKVSSTSGPRVALSEFRELTGLARSCCHARATCAHEVALRLRVFHWWSSDLLVVAPPAVLRPLGVSHHQRISSD